MTVQEQEKLHHTRLRALAKGRKTRARNAERRRQNMDRHAERFNAWIRREHTAFDQHLAFPADRELRTAWLRVLRERPELYGKREAS